MSVYVDPLLSYGWKHGRSCHLIADSLEELHAFALAMGLRRAWFQPESSPHYDLTARRRADAVRLGAVELERGPFVAKVRAHREARRRPETTP